MGGENGNEKRGQIIGLGQKRAERTLPEITEEMARRTLDEFAKNIVERLSGKNLAAVDVAWYGDSELEEILFQALQNMGNSRDNFQYAAAQEYLKRKKIREQTQNPSN